MNEPILDKNDLVRYMLMVHDTEYEKPISRIKLQKGLYFLFAFWVQKFSEQKEQHSEVEDLMENLSPVLFDSNFRAWAYGPVDREIYDSHKNGKLIPFNDKEAKSFIDQQPIIVSTYLQNMVRRIFNSSDFGLVDLSHRDESWISNYDPTDFYHDEIIPQEQIISEYEKKKSI